MHAKINCIVSLCVDKNLKPSLCGGFFILSVRTKVFITKNPPVIDRPRVLHLTTTHLIITVRMSIHIQQKWYRQ